MPETATPTHAPPGSPEAGLACLCSPLLNDYGSGLRTAPGGDPDGSAWLVDPMCTVHSGPYVDSSLWAAALQGPERPPEVTT